MLYDILYHIQYLNVKSFAGDLGEIAGLQEFLGRAKITSVSDTSLLIPAKGLSHSERSKVSRIFFKRFYW